MVNREIVMDYILSCLQDLVENGVEIKPDSDLVNDLGLESIKVMDLLMMLEETYLPYTLQKLHHQKVFLILHLP